MKYRVLELYDIISAAQAELDQIRAECKHDGGYHINNYSWRIGAWSPMRICDVCDAPVGGITDEEVKSFQAKEEEKAREWRKANGVEEPT